MHLYLIKLNFNATVFVDDHPFYNSVGNFGGERFQFGVLPILFNERSALLGSGLWVCSNGNMLPLKNAGAFADTSTDDGKEENSDEEVLL